MGVILSEVKNPYAALTTWTPERQFSHLMILAAKINPRLAEGSH